MFGKKKPIRIAYEYLTAGAYQQEQLLSALLKVDPIKSTEAMINAGVYVLNEYAKANLTTPYRNAPATQYQAVMLLSQKVTNDIQRFTALVGDRGILHLCDALTSPYYQPAILTCFALGQKIGYSPQVLERINDSLHNLDGSLPERIRMLIVILITYILAQEDYGEAYDLLQMEALRTGKDWRETARQIMAEALGYLLPYEISAPKPKPTSTDIDSGYDQAAAWHNYWTWWDPDNAPWNYDN